VALCTPSHHPLRGFYVPPFFPCSLPCCLLGVRELLTQCGLGCSTNADVLGSGGGPGSAPVPHHKVLVFAQRSRMLDLIDSQVLTPHFPGAASLRIDGAGGHAFLSLCCRPEV
jgi:hypothetical protein